jgi:uncharacterized protein YceK
MRVMCVLLVAAVLTGCASYRNRAPEPGNNYWPINKAETEASGGSKHVE